MSNLRVATHERRHRREGAAHKLVGARDSQRRLALLKGDAHVVLVEQLRQLRAQNGEHLRRHGHGARRLSVLIEPAARLGACLLEQAAGRGEQQLGGELLQRHLRGKSEALQRLQRLAASEHQQLHVRRLHI